MLDLATSLWARMEGSTFTGPCCTDEEILIGIMVSDYDCWLGSAELEPGIVDLDGLWSQDDDYLLLYDNETAERGAS